MNKYEEELNRIKKMTIRKALNRIKNILIYEDMDPSNPCNDYIEYKGDLKNCYKEEVNTIERDLEVLNIKAKAFDIILKRELNIQLFRKNNYKDYKEYLDNTGVNENSTLLTEDEFDFVQEVLK